MRPVQIPQPLLAEIQRHGREAYPDECCGFLVALPDPAAPEGARSIVATKRAANEFEGERRRRFAIRPEELRAAERELEGSDSLIAGFYHSHPDHPARPSAFDQEHAWPWYTYVVVSVSAAGVPAIAAFELEPDSRVFREVPLAAPLPDDARVTERIRASGAR